MRRVAGLVLCLVLGACGLKGNLYLPAEPESEAGAEADAPPAETPELDPAVEATEDVDSAEIGDDEP